jgi:hypothetical protein
MGSSFIVPLVILVNQPRAHEFFIPSPNQSHPMNRALCSLLVGLLATSLTWSQPAPVTLTIQSYQALAHGMTRVVDAVSPGAANDAMERLREALGLQELKGVDLTRPWQIALWADDFSVPPSLSVRIPVTDFTTFRNGLEPGLLKGDAGAERPIEQVGDYAKIWLQFGSPSETTRAAEKAWQPNILTDVSGVLRLVIHPNPSIRTELINGLAMGRMMVGMAMAGQADQAPAGMDMNAMAELLAVYFDVLETGLKGFESFLVELDLDADSLKLREIITPLAGSDLAAWFQSKPGNLDALTRYLDRSAPMALAMQFGDNPALQPTLRRFVALSLQMQGLAPDSDAARQTQQLLESFLPFRLSGNLHFDKGFEFDGLYQFPGKDTADVYADVKKFLESAAKDQVGEDQPYEEISFEPAQRKSHGLSVDRVTMVLNLDIPIYSMPGQKEMIESFWPGGRMIFDYALKGQDLFMGSPARLDALLERAATTAPGPTAGLTPHTVAYGHVNLFKLLPSMLAFNPMIPEEDKARFNRIDSTGTDIGFRLDLDGRFSYAATIPIQCFRVIGQLAE